MPEAVERDASILKRSLRGAVTDHKAVAEIICTRSGSQLRQIKQVYYNTFGAKLEQDIESEASGNHKRVCFDPSDPCFLIEIIVIDIDMYLCNRFCSRI